MAKEIVYQAIDSIYCKEGITSNQERFIGSILDSLKQHLPFKEFLYYIGSDYIDLGFNRYETDEEEQARLEKVKQAEYEQYLELKKKFEGK